eukprot:gene6859-12458_t
MPKLQFVSLVTSSETDDLLRVVLAKSTATKLKIADNNQTICMYSKSANSSETCTCAQGAILLSSFWKRGQCICKRCYVADIPEIVALNSTDNLNSTNVTYSLRPELNKVSKNKKSTEYSIILGTFSVVALVVNFVILARMCSCKHQSVSKIFGMSLMLFNVLLAEYGIALAIYMTQEKGVWGRSFCQAMTALKLFSMCAIIFSLLCLTFQSSINPPDDNYNSQDVRFKAVVYVLEGSVLAAMICILSWTKFDDWDYSCQIFVTRKTADEILVVTEYCYHASLFLLAIRYPYKTFRQKEPSPSYIKMKEVVEREHPIFVMTLFTFLSWSIPFIVTIPQLNVTSEFLTSLVRNCSLMFGAIVLPILIVIRNSRVCCSKHKACGVNDPHVCQCKGESTNMCYACEMQHQDMISKCDMYSFGDRRKSLSLDDLKYVLGVYKKETHCSLKVQRKKLISRSYPIINMDTIEEAELENISDIDRLFSACKGKSFDYSLESSNRGKRALSRDNSLSLPVLTSPKKNMPARKKIPLHAKLSHSPCKSALPSPVKRSLQKKRAASLDTSKVVRITHSPCSDASTVSSPSRSGDESKHPDNEKRKQKVKRKLLAKSKESVKSKDSIKSKDSAKSRENGNEKLSKEKGGTDSSDVTTPSRESRIPSFIPLSDADPTTKKSVPRVSSQSNTAKTKESKSSWQAEKSSEEEDKALLGEDPDRVPSRGPTFFFVGTDDNENIDDDKEDVLKPLVAKEEKEPEKLEKKPKRKGKRKKSEQRSLEGTPARESAPLGSLHSLEWDPSFSLSDSSCSSPIDEYVPPSPAPPPSSFALQRLKEMGAKAPDSPQASIGRSSNYSMDWDPTGVQMRHSLVSPCEWEPYSVDEAISNPTSPDIADLQKHIEATVHTGREFMSISPDKKQIGKAPLASEEI